MAKKTKRYKAPSDENTRARPAIFIITGLLIWMNLLATLVGIRRFIQGEVNFFVFTIQVLIFLCLTLGFAAVFIPFPELHTLMYVGLLANFILSLIAFVIGDATQFIQALLSITALYLSFRFPITFDSEDYVLR